MSNAQFEQFKKRLLMLKTEIEVELAQDSSADSSITPDNAIGRLTRMEAIQAQSISNAGKRRSEKRLKLVGRALQAVDDGSYGRCVKCSEKIPIPRLEIRPESMLCVRCASR